MVTLEQLNEIAAMLSEHDSADDDETLRVSVQSMAKLLAELYHLRRQVTELQAHNTARQERARAAVQERDEARAALAVETKNANAYAHERDDARKSLRLEREQHSRVIEQWEAAKASHAEARTEMQLAQRALEEAKKANAEALARVVVERDAALSDAKWRAAAIAIIREEIEPECEHMTVVEYIRGLKRTIDDLRAGQPRAIASSLDGVRRERDEARAECERMRAERAEARTETQRAQFALDGVRRERDEARAALAMCGNALDAYQLAAMRTTIHARGDAGANALTWNALGIAGEAGEVADIIKKHVGHGHELDRTKLTKELGDVLWYVAALAHDIGVDLSTVARENVEKLKTRYPDGFSQERSRNRVAE